jgi:hypothetical protein
VLSHSGCLRYNQAWLPPWHKGFPRLLLPQDTGLLDDRNLTAAQFMQARDQRVQSLQVSK